MRCPPDNRRAAVMAREFRGDDIHFDRCPPCSRILRYRHPSKMLWKHATRQGDASQSKRYQINAAQSALNSADARESSRTAQFVPCELKRRYALEASDCSSRRPKPHSRGSLFMPDRDTGISGFRFCRLTVERI